MVRLGKAYMEDDNSRKRTKALQQMRHGQTHLLSRLLCLAQSLHKLGRIDECRQVSVTGIDVSTKNGDAMVTKNLEALKSTLPT